MHFLTATDMSPPRTRGSTLGQRDDRHRANVSPAHAGIDPLVVGASSYTVGLPRARGDRPHSACRNSRDSMSPPRTRGSTRRADVQLHTVTVSPAHAGIDPCLPSIRRGCRCLPRARGDRPVTPDKVIGVIRSPPRTRGSTHVRHGGAAARHVSPAHAGIDPKAAMPAIRAPCLPRARGDRPKLRIYPSSRLESPPRTRGSTLGTENEANNVRVAPAHAGIDRNVPVWGDAYLWRLCVRPGDDSRYRHCDCTWRPVRIHQLHLRRHDDELSHVRMRRRQFHFRVRRHDLCADQDRD